MTVPYTDPTNSKHVAGTCRYCKRRAILRTFDGRTGGAWYHVWEQCSLCGESDRMALPAYEADLKQTLAPDRAKASEGDAAAERRVAKHLIEEARWDLAREALAELRQRNPADAELDALEARVEAESATGGWVALERAWKLAPGDTALLDQLAASYVAEQEHARAAEAYAELERREPERLEYPLALARALAKIGRFEEATAAFERLFVVAPDRKRAGWIVLEAKEARAAIGLTLEENDARKRGRSRRSTRVFFLVVAVVAALGFGGAAILNRRVRIVVENPTPRPITVQLDGQPWVVVRPGGHEVVTIWQGEHKVVTSAEGVADAPGGAPLSDDVTWEAPGIDGLDNATFVFDPFRVGLFEVHEVGYGPSPRRLMTAEQHLCERTFYAGTVDSLFRTPAPIEVPLDSGESKTRRILWRLTLTPDEVAHNLVQHQRAPDAVRYLENRVAWEPDNELLRATLEWAKAQAAHAH